MIDKFLRKYNDLISLFVFVYGIHFLRSIYINYDLNHFCWFFVQEILVVIGTCIYFYAEIVDRKLDKGIKKDMIIYFLILSAANFSVMYLIP